VEPVPSPSVMPGSTRSTAQCAAARFRSSCVSLPDGGGEAAALPMGWLVRGIGIWEGKGFSLFFLSFSGGGGEGIDWVAAWRGVFWELEF
jgi:hypothetical protein